MRDVRIQLAKLKKPKIIVLEGISGIGKSTQGFRLKKLLEDKAVHFPDKLGNRAVEANEMEGLPLFDKYLVNLRDFAENTPHEFILAEGGYATLMAKAFNSGVPLSFITSLFKDTNSEIMDINKKFGYLEIILMPDYEESELTKGLEMFKSSNWGASINCEFIDIEKDETILDIAKKIKKVLENYNVFLKED